MKISQMSKKFTKNNLEEDDVQFCNTTNIDNELQNNLEENENNYPLTRQNVGANG